MMKRVLIVEDTIDIGRFYQDAIRAAYPGVQITLTPSGEEAILEATLYNYELLITDLRLPGINGFDLARKIRQRQPDVRILVITGLSIDEAMRERAEGVKVDRLLAKPVDFEAFLQAIAGITGEEPRLPAAGREVAAPAAHQPAGVSRPTGGTHRRGEQTRPLKDGPGARAVQPAPPPAQTAPAELPSLSDLLSSLRSSLGALAAILLNDQGRVAAKAGDWPEAGLEERLVPGLMAGLNSFEKISGQMQEGLPSAAHALRGSAYDLAFAPVGRYALLVFLRSSSGVLRLALAFEHLLSVQSQVAQVLQDMGLNIRPLAESPLPAVQPLEEASLELPVGPAPQVAQSAPVPPAPEDPARLDALATLLGQSQNKPVIQDADDFWDSLVAEQKPSTPSLPSTGELSYEQARKLGLLPSDS